MATVNKFKNLSGAWLLKPIFFEMADSDKSRVLYTLKPEDHTVLDVTYPSLRRLYLDMADESEYFFAKEYFGGWPHWKRLLTCSWFLDYLTEIREELKILQIAEAKARIREIARDKSNRGSLQANRIILDETKKSDHPVGRPSRESIRREAEAIFKDHSDYDEDLRRITESFNDSKKEQAA